MDERQRNQRSNCQHALEHRKSNRIPEKNKQTNKQTSTSVLLTTLKAFDWVDHNKLWTILQEMGIPDHLPYLLRNLYADQEATVRTRHGTMG